MHYFTQHPSPIGTLTLACNGGGDSLVGLWIHGQKYYGHSLPQGAKEKSDLFIFDETKRWLDKYFAGQKPGPRQLSLAPIGSGFRQAVWRILLEIPYGELITYGEIAKRVAAGMNRKSMSSQAVGGAVGHNPISIIIPCHRVVGSQGSLTGFAAGLEIKQRLLELEGVDLSDLSVPKKGTAL